VPDQLKRPPQWMVGEAITFLREQHPTVLAMVARMFYESKSKTIEDWLKVERSTWGVRLVGLISQMRVNWEQEDRDLLRDSWVGIVVSALKAESLVDGIVRKA